MGTTIPATPRRIFKKLGLALAIAPLLAWCVGLSAPAAENANSNSAKVKKAAKAKNAADPARVKKSARRNAESSKADDAPTTPLPDRPKKAVTPPTLTPAALDAMVEKSLASAKVPLAAITTDVEFVRRIYLDVTGKIPTPDQARAFVNTRERDKRAKLIDHLLASPEYAANWAHYWRDVIVYHATNQNLVRIGAKELEDWLAAQIAKNRPWDEVTHDLIVASGRTDENGATAFIMAHDADPVEMAGEVSRIFLGVQIQCAQCHDHPTDSWKRQQFHEFAAFFARPKPRRAEKPMPGKPAVFEVALRGKPRYTMPDLKNPQTKVPVAPRFFLASNSSSVPAGLTAAQRHELAASLVTGQDNPWFGKAYVNRVWAALVGEPFYAPVDDLGPQRTARSPEVIEALATQWQQGGYDVRWLFRTVLNSKTYQREVRSTYSASGRTPFASNCPSRLRADQILDSLALALNLPVDARPGQGQGPRKGQGQGAGAAAEKKAARKNALTADLKEAVGKVKGAGRPGGPRLMFNVLFGVDPSIPSDDVLGTIPQALFLMNAPLVNRAIEARPGTVLGQILATHPDNRQALGAVYVRVLAREPTLKEVQACGRYLEAVGDRREAFEDILWSLINSTEFISRR